MSDPTANFNFKVNLDDYNDKEIRRAVLPKTTRIRIKCIREDFRSAPATTVFHAGEIHGHNIVIATFAAGQPYGTSSATSLASHVRKSFSNLWFGLLVGVASACSPPRDIRRGDVIVALSEGDYPAILPYGLGKQKGTEAVLRYYNEAARKDTKFSDPGQENDFLYLSCHDTPFARQRRPDAKRTRVWYGSIGSGDKLLKSRRDRDELRDKYNVIGLEMEAAGVMNEIPVGNIRGVCLPQDLLVADPETERRRIEATKGGLLDDSVRWVLGNAEFQEWHTNHQSQLLWIKGDPGKGKTMLMIGIINELLQKIQAQPSQSIAYFLRLHPFK
ncbi:hypothetical protein BDV12DRAFT_187758 [Aspergillus spectabilis]